MKIAPLLSERVKKSKNVMLSAAKHLCSSSWAAEPKGELRRSFARRKARRAQDDAAG
jgi:hypothetical protein